MASTTTLETVTSADGTPIAFERTGRGPPLVLVHGTTADHTRWEPVRSTFEEHVTLYAIDRRGRGESGDTAEYSLNREVEDVVAVVESIGEPVNLLGHSFGALCALEAALRTDALRTLILYEPAFPVNGHSLYPEDVVREMETLLAAGENETALVVLFEKIAGVTPEQIDVLRSAPNWPDRVAAAHTVLRETYAEEEYTFDASRFTDMTTPTLLLSGSESPEVLRAATDVIHEALPESRIAPLVGQGHIAQSTAPALFTDEVLAFIRESH